MMGSDTTAEQCAARASELAVAQKGRYAKWLKTKGKRPAFDFYAQGSEIEVTALIVDLMSSYASLKGFIRPDTPIRATQTRRAADRS